MHQEHVCMHTKNGQQVTNMITKEITVNQTKTLSNYTKGSSLK